MKLYLIAIAVAILGIFVSSKVQARNKFCGGSETVFSLSDWQSGKDKAEEPQLSFDIISNDEKAISSVGGYIVLHKGDTSIAELPLELDNPVAAKGSFSTTLLARTARKPFAPETTIGAQAFVCIFTINYSDGSGVIIN